MDRIIIEDRFSRRYTKLPPEFGIPYQRFQCAYPLLFGRNQPPVLEMSDDVRRVSNVAGDGWQPERHVLNSFQATFPRYPLVRCQRIYTNVDLLEIFDFALLRPAYNFEIDTKQFITKISDYPQLEFTAGIELNKDIA